MPYMHMQKNTPHTYLITLSISTQHTLLHIVFNFDRRYFFSLPPFPLFLVAIIFMEFKYYDDQHHMTPSPTPYPLPTITLSLIIKC